MGWTENRDGRWRGVYRDATGRKHHSPLFMHHSAADDWQREQQSKVTAGVWRDPRRGQVPLRDFVPLWLDARHVEHTTGASDAGRLAVILAEFGDTPLEHITPLVVAGWLKRLSAGRASGTVAKYQRLLSSILQAAVIDQRLDANPCRNLPKRGGVSAAREVYLTHGQVAAVLDQLGEPARTVVHTLAYTGLRWGELTGLHKGRVDFLRRTLTVAETMTEVGRDRRLKPYPKGKTTRHVPLPSHLVAALAQHLATHPAFACGLPAEGRHRCTGLMFTAPEGRRAGEPLSRHWWARAYFAPAVAAANQKLAANGRALIPAGVRVHDLRHTYASWVAQAGVPLRVLQYRLGHASITTTERYAHFLPDGDGHGLAGLDEFPEGLADSSGVPRDD